MCRLKFMFKYFVAGGDVRVQVQVYVYVQVPCGGRL